MSTRTRDTIDSGSTNHTEIHECIAEAAYIMIYSIDGDCGDSIEIAGALGAGILIWAGWTQHQYFEAVVAGSIIHIRNIWTTWAS